MKIEIVTVMLCLCVTCCSPQSSSSSGEQVVESDEVAGCRAGAEAMIDIAAEAVNDTRSRPERRAVRRELMVGWTDRLQEGEDPCSVYQDIMKASTTF